MPASKSCRAIWAGVSPAVDMLTICRRRAIDMGSVT